MEMILGALVVAYFVKTVPTVLADAVATARASKAGAWEVVEADRARREGRAARRADWGERLAAAWAERRRERASKAGATDGTYRPGARAYLGDVYHGFWEDSLAKRQARREVREPFDPTAPSLADRVAERIRARVDQMREAKGRPPSAPSVGPMSDDRWLDDPEMRTDVVHEPTAEEREHAAMQAEERAARIAEQGKRHAEAERTQGAAPKLPILIASVVKAYATRDLPAAIAAFDAMKKYYPDFYAKHDTAGLHAEMREFLASHGPTPPAGGESDELDFSRFEEPKRPPAPGGRMSERDRLAAMLADGQRTVANCPGWAKSPAHSEHNWDGDDEGRFFCQGKTGDQADDPHAWTRYVGPPGPRSSSSQGKNNYVVVDGVAMKWDPNLGTWVLWDPAAWKPIGIPADDSATQPEGDKSMSAPTVDEVQTNDAARESFKRQMEAAAEAADALSAYELAQRKLAALATAGIDGMSGTKFDALATAAQAEVADLIGTSEMSAAAAAIDNIATSAKQGYDALEKYRDAEDLVASNNIDAKVLEPSAS